MITHNGKYLSAATHHGMPIVAATMGGKMVFRTWLLFATQQAIVAAFGAEGTEVIAKTNDYLNQIATTDPQRALLLAGFINEDPMLVTSLVETSKTRWLVGDGKAYINTEYYPQYADIISLGMIVEQIGPSWSGCRKYPNYQFAIGNNSSQQRMFLGFSDKSVYLSTFDYWNIPAIYTIDKDGAYINEEKITSWSASSINSEMSFTLFARNDSYSNGIVPAPSPIFMFKSPIREMYPFIRNGENGMLDIISGTFYPNANTQGSFTIALTPKTTS